MNTLSLWATEAEQNGYGVTFKVKQTLFRGMSDFQTVDIIETDTFGRMLFLDGLVMTTERDEFVYHEMITHPALLAHPEPKQVLVIGGGDGGTVREVLKHPSVERVVLCEIDGMVIDACRQFLPTIAGQLSDPRVEILVKDGIAYMAEQAQLAEQFDVILIDSSDPVGPGEGLFTQAFYQNTFQALKPNGILTVQSESPLVNQKLFQAIQQVLGQVYPVTQPYVATIPTYPGAYWSWTFCSKQGQRPLEAVNWPLAETIAKTTRLYNPEVHQAVFALPNFVRQLLPSVSTNTPVAAKS